MRDRDRLSLKNQTLIVGVGASAGGLEAFQQLLSALGHAAGVAIVFVQHLDPHGKSLMAELLRKTTPMAVVELSGRVKLKGGHVYLCPPQRLLEMKSGFVQVVENDDEARLRHVIDHFLHSLALDQSDRAVGVILSGAGSDGTLGLKAIIDAGGLTFAQEPMSAKFDSMPRSAATTGVADHVLTPNEIAKELLQYSEHLSRLRGSKSLIGMQEKIVDAIPTIAELLLKVTNHNFHHENSDEQPAVASPHDADSIIMHLERKLDATRSDLDKSMQDLEAGNEELKSSNEELLSMNEELQSTNEELETSKDEISAGSEAVTRAKSDLENLLRSSQIATVFLDDELLIRSFTPAITEIYGLISTDIGRPLQRFVPHVKDMPPLPDPKSLINERSIEHTIVAESGKSFIRRVLPYQSNSGDFEGIVVSFLDVTQLHDSQALFKLLVDASAQIVWITNADGLVVEDSPSWRLFTGQSFEQWIGDGWLDAVHPDDREPTLSQWKTVVELNGTFSIEYRLRNHRGEYRWTHVRAVAQRNSDGSVKRWVGMNIDIDDQKRAEQELRDLKQQLADAKERLDLSLEISDVATWNWNRETDDVLSNPALNRMFGFEPDEKLVLADFINQMDESVRTRVAASIEDAVKSGVRYEQEYPIRLRNGDIRHVRAVGKAQQPDGSRPQHFFGVVLDITERKQRELDTAEREAHLRRVINNQLGLVGVIDRDGILLEVDDRSLQIARTRREEIIGKHFADAPWWNYDPSVAQTMRDAMQRALAGEIIRYDVSLFSHGDEGVMIDFMIAPVFDDDGKVEYLIPSGVDIRERYIAEKQLLESEKRFRAMVDGLPLMIWVHDHEGKRVAVNRAFCDFYNVDEEQMRNMEWQTLVHPEHFRHYTEEFARCVKEQCPFHAEVEVKRADGQWRWLESWGQPHFSDAQEFRGHIGASADITDRKRQAFHIQFIAEFQERLDLLSASNEIAGAAAKKVFDWINPSRCNLIHFLHGGEVAEVFDEMHGVGLSSSLGRYSITDFMGEGELELLRSDRPLVFNDIHSSSLSVDEVQRYAEFRTRALLVLPYISSGELKFALSIDSDLPREWEPYEVELLQEVTERLYLRLQGAWAEERTRELTAQLRESNERLEMATSAAKMGMFDWNIDTDTVAWDEAHLDLTGLKNQPHSGRNFHSLTHSLRRCRGEQRGHRSSNSQRSGLQHSVSILPP